MRFTPSEMPSTEQVAVTVLREEGFYNIHWESLVDWRSPYDFRATKEGIEYLIEVKPEFNAIRHGKIRNLTGYFNPIIFLTRRHSRLILYTEIVDYILSHKIRLISYKKSTKGIKNRFCYQGLKEE